jgi:hypothetical protein
VYITSGSPGNDLSHFSVHGRTNIPEVSYQIKWCGKFDGKIFNEHLSGPVEEGTIEEGVELLATWNSGSWHIFHLTQ